jgi:hypothetical protein
MHRKHSDVGVGCDGEEYLGGDWSGGRGVAVAGKECGAVAFEVDT